MSSLSGISAVLSLCLLSEHIILTDLIACELDSRVVLDLPQALVETFPLVGLAKFVFILLVGQKILWT